MRLLNFSEIMDRIEKLEEANLRAAALKFKIFTHLGKTPRTSKFIANKAKLDPEGASALLDALCAMKVLIKKNNKYKNSSESFKYLCESSKDFKKGTVFLKQDMREEWSGLLEVLKNGRNLEEFEGEDDANYRELFTHAMHERSENYSKPLAKIVARKSVGKLLDVGGGLGRIPQRF
ncbi:MAG: methyltransferase dimerization domain-containing protein [Nitrospinota bacterium]